MNDSRELYEGMKDADARRVGSIHPITRIRIMGLCGKIRARRRF